MRNDVSVDGSAPAALRIPVMCSADSESLIANASRWDRAFSQRDAFLLCASQGKLDLESVALDAAHVAAVHAGDTPRGKQAQTRAGLAGIRRTPPAKEALEEVRRFVGIWSWSAA